MPHARANPRDVHGPSQVVDAAAFSWQDADWSGRAWHEAVIYELHLGTFTAEGSFAAARGKRGQFQQYNITPLRKEGSVPTIQHHPLIFFKALLTVM